jgi:hypothetical protein
MDIMQHPKKLTTDLHDARRQLQKCQKLINAMTTPGDPLRRQDLETGVRQALANVFYMLRLFHEKSPPSEVDAVNVAKTGKDIARHALSELKSSDEDVDDL